MMQSDAPRMLYKFSGATDYALQNLERGVIFCQHYSAYNDPFEFWGRILEGIPDAKSEANRFKVAKEAWGCDWMSPEDEDLIEYFAACESEQPSFHHWRDITRIACFGSDPKNLLMWSHYADGLRGLCLVLDETELLEASPRSTFSVNVAYQAEPPTADAFVYAVANDQMDYHLLSIEDAESRAKHLGEPGPSWLEEYREVAGNSYVAKIEILQKVFATKPVEWAYEAEKRLLVRAEASDASPVFHKYPKAALKGVLIGERTPNDYRRRLEQVVSSHYGHAYVKSIRRSSSSYSLKIG